MDDSRFISQFASLQGVTPELAEFRQICDRLSSEISANLLQLLNIAVDCLEADEVFCEVGYGATAPLIGALYNHPDCMAYSVHDLSQFLDREARLEHILGELSLFEVEEQVYFCEQQIADFLLELREIESDNQIGLYYCAGTGNYRSQLMALLLVRPFLAERALIVIAQTDSEIVQQACWDFIAANPECQILLEDFGIAGGVQVLSWHQDRRYNYSAIAFQEKQQPQVIQSLANVAKFNAILDTTYQQAVTLHQQQQFTLAEAKYQELLTWRTEDARVWTNLGILYYQVGNYRESLKTIWQALERDKESDIVYYYLGLVYDNLRQGQQAIAAFQKALEVNPHLIEAYHRLGHQWVISGDFEQAISLYQKAIEQNPDDASLYHQFGNLLLESEQVEAAITAYQTALNLDPENSEVTLNLNLAIALQNQSAEAYLTLAKRFYQQKRYSQAIATYQQALTLAEGDAEVYYELSESLAFKGQTEEAIALLQKAVNLFPKAAYLHFSLILKQIRLGYIPEAIIAAENAYSHLPEDYTFKLLKYLIIPPFYNSPEEIDFYRQRFQSGLERLIAETDLDTPEQQQSALQATSRFTNFYLGYQAYNIIKQQRRYGQLLHQIMGANFPQWTEALEIPPVEAKIRVGYVSHYLHAYSGTLWLTGWLKYCDRNQFEVYCYYTGNAPDPITQQFRESSDRFYHFPGNLTATCQQIRADNLHILVFPEIGMDPQTMQIAALRLAPIQCATWGHPVTTGLPTIDYFLSSELMEPENAQEHYSETLIQLPNIGVSYPKPNDIPTLTKTRSHFDLPEEAVLYFCGQAPYKYLPQYDRIFPQIALKVPQARFLFLRGTQLKPRLAKAFAEFGLDSEQYCLHRSVPERVDYLMLNLLCDIFLDTFTWSGGNTSLEAIACNLPIVTCPGEFMRGRHADSFLKMLGVTDTLAQNETEYIEIAVRLGLEPQWREEIKQRMSQRHDRLFEDRSCVTGLESFFRQVLFLQSPANP